MKAALFLAGVGSVLLLSLLIALIVHADPRVAYGVVCRAQGGHIYQPGSTAFCLTDDGRMLEVPAQ